MVRVQVAGGRLVLKADLLTALNRGAATARLLAGGALDRPVRVRDGQSEKEEKGKRVFLRKLKTQIVCIFSPIFNPLFYSNAPCFNS